MSRIVFFIDTNRRGFTGNWARDVVITVQEGYIDGIHELKKDDWNEVRDSIDDSDEESEFDEKLLPRRYRQEFDEEKEINSRMIQCLEALIEAKGFQKINVRSCPEIQEYETFDANNAQNLNDLLFHFKKKNQVDIVVEKEPIVSKYKAEYKYARIIRKKSYYKDLKVLFVVFMWSIGCCSSSQRCRRIYSSLEKAENFAKKLYNGGQAEFDPECCSFQKDQPNTPAICRFIWNDNKQCFLYDAEVKNY